MTGLHRLATTTSGFSLLDLLVSLALTVLVASIAAAVLISSIDATGAQPEQADVQQRARVIDDLLHHDLQMAGAGPYLGNDVGSLGAGFAALIPRRIGLTGSDAATIARSDAVTITYVPTTYVQTTTSAPSSETLNLNVNGGASCPIGAPACGIQTGSTVAVFDRTSHLDIFTVKAIAGNVAQVRTHSGGGSYTYPVNSRVVQVESRTYYLDTSANQLRMYDGYQTDVPVADNVVSLAFDYFGEGGLPLPLARFTDGPWYGAGATMFDADLLSVRAIRVTARLQAPLSAFRASSSLFLRPGTSQSSRRYVPDVTTTFTVWPRNLISPV
jgi:type II secretory pathway pseudopilin PulG